MIRVKVELIPFGNKKYTKEIARLDIINNKTGNEDIGNYDFKLYEFMEIFDTKKNKPINVMTINKEGKFCGHKRKENIWQLIKNILNLFT